MKTMSAAEIKALCKAAAPLLSSLARATPESLCPDHINGFCAKGENCAMSHAITDLRKDEPQSHPELKSHPNFLDHAPRRPVKKVKPFDDDGPGELAKKGPRHDNDFINIQDIKILPTTDEILSHRVPYMPKKDPHAPHRLPCGQERLLDTQFRQLRYESTEKVVDCCYHASQRLTQMVKEPQKSDYEYGMVTPRGAQYSLFRDIAFEDVYFSSFKGINVRVSYACPRALRGQRMNQSKHLQEGMLVALVGFDGKTGISTTFMEIDMRQTTEAMRPRTKNDLRASVILTFADVTDIEAVRRILHNARGPGEENFVMVEIPTVLYAGFHWTLKNLQNLSKSNVQLAFSSSLAPSIAGASPIIEPPKYAKADGFAFRLDPICRNDIPRGKGPLTLRPSDFLSSRTAQIGFVHKLCTETTLDRGQAKALCESLCRDLAFTLGPPGTGKTFLGVALTKVLLASRDPSSPKPILIVCTTNHALDSFLADLVEAGITKLARLGGNSKEEWTKKFQMPKISHQVKKTQIERTKLRQIREQVEGLSTEGTSWCESLNSKTVSWPAVREHLRFKDPAILDCFTRIEAVKESAVSDIRLARKAGGFAYEYWCQGGDIRDVDLLLKHFSTILGNLPEFQNDASDQELQTKSHVLDTVYNNANDMVASDLTGEATGKANVWKLTKEERDDLIAGWQKEIGVCSILHRTAEIHRRHQEAISRKRTLNDELDARCLAQLDVIGLTTTACAMKWPLLKEIGLQTVICEEAGEIMEAHSICTLLPTIEHAISIGDPLQLRPQVKEQSLSLETTLGASYRLDESLMERMILPSTPGVQPIPSSRLTIQRRMHPEIADIMRATLYPFLEDHDSTLLKAPVAAMVDRIWWLDHKVPEDVQSPHSATASSSSNAYEVEMVVGLVEYLVKSNEYNLKDITILTPYNGQLAAFTRRLTGNCSLWLNEKDRESLIADSLVESEELPAGVKTDVSLADTLRLATIDNFQGEESKVVILSTVRSNLEGKTGFLKTSNRINVGCSRAKEGFYIVGNASLMSKVPMWDQITRALTIKAKIGPAFRACCRRHPKETYLIQRPQQWAQIPECTIPCGVELSCGHICKMTCHAPDLHERVACAEPCKADHKGCGHHCTKTCGEPCGDCLYQVPPTMLACGHEIATTCSASQKPDELMCEVLMASEKLACGHYLQKTCATKHEPSICTEKGYRQKPCEHKCTAKCQACNAVLPHMRWTTKCNKKLPCGHECTEKYHSGECPPCQLLSQISCCHKEYSYTCGEICCPCVEKCDWQCSHHGSCTTICGLPCNRLPCSEPCHKTLTCGHLCPGLCGERCLTECLQCSTGLVPKKTRMELPCGHQFDLEFIDNHLKINEIYQLDGNGRIEKAIISSNEQCSTTSMTCPTCGESCNGARRYSLPFQLSAFPRHSARMFTLFESNFNTLKEQMCSEKKELDATFDEYSYGTKSGPLTGMANERRTRERGNALSENQACITGFREKVIRPFEVALDRLATYFGHSTAMDENSTAIQYRIRFDLLFHASRLIILQEGGRMLAELIKIRGVSRHTDIMCKGLEAMIADEAANHLPALKIIIEECDSEGLVEIGNGARNLETAFGKL